MDNLSIGEYRDFLNKNKEVKSIGEISDGYHTFDDLYEHRCLLFLLAAKNIFINSNWGSCWISKKHFDGSEWEGWFIVGANLTQNDNKVLPITYHLPSKYWDKAVGFCKVLERAPEWDGHTSDDVIDRILGSL